MDGVLCTLAASAAREIGPRTSTTVVAPACVAGRGGVRAGVSSVFPSSTASMSQKFELPEGHFLFTSYVRRVGRGANGQ